MTLFSLFLVFWIGQALAGWRHQLDERRAHGEPPIARSENEA